MHYSEEGGNFPYEKDLWINAEELRLPSMCN